MNEMKEIFNILREYVGNEHDLKVFNHIVKVTEFSKKRAEDNNLSRDLVKLITLAASVHDVAKFHSVIDSIFKERPKGIFHGLVGSYFLMNYNNALTGMLENKESLSRIIACHIPFFIKKEEMLDYMVKPLPYFDIENPEEYEIGGIMMMARPLFDEEKIATQVLIATDNCIAEDEYVGIEKRLGYIFGKYGDKVYTDAGKRVYASRVKSLIEKYPMKDEK
ncbi:MAG: HD domain-containing protein [archaeon]